MEKPKSNRPQSGTQLHLTFIEMLFALAIGQVAIGFSELIYYQSTSNQTLWAVIPAYSHLLLAAAVISTSWVGWRISVYSGSDIKSVFSLDYIELLIDVTLVIMYFALARAVEIPDPYSASFCPDASFEAYAVAIIISTYVLWDVVSCRSKLEKLHKRLWASISCTIISWLLVWSDIGGSGTVWAVLLGDCSLMALILTFRAMKLHDLSEHTWKSWILILSLLSLVLISSIGSIKL